VPCAVGPPLGIPAASTPAPVAYEPIPAAPEQLRNLVASAPALPALVDSASCGLPALANKTYQARVLAPTAAVHAPDPTAFAPTPSALAPAALAIASAAPAQAAFAPTLGALALAVLAVASVALALALAPDFAAPLLVLSTFAPSSAAAAAAPGLCAVVIDVVAAENLQVTAPA